MKSIHQHRHRLAIVTGGVLFAIVGGAPVWGQATFQGLGDLPGGAIASWATAVSADGTVVVGTARSAQLFEAFRWTAEGGMIGLGQFPSSFPNSNATATSADGSVVVGRSFSNGRSRAFRWTEENGLQDLGSLLGNGSQATSGATDVSSDGRTIVGSSRSPIPSFSEAFRWIPQQPMVGIGGRVAGGISADGMVVVGIGSTPEANLEAVRWTQKEGPIGLGLLSDTIRFSQADAASADGSVAVGVSQNDVGFDRAFRWTTEQGMVALDIFRELSLTQALSVSGDGSVIVGSEFTLDGDAALLWEPGGTIRNLRELLITEHGLDLTGWTLTSATGISGDGLTIVGIGINPQGLDEAWIVTLPPPAPPCPADLNDDGVVDVHDLLQVVHALRTRGDMPEDLDGNGLVDPRDMHIVIRSFGPCPE